MKDYKEKLKEYCKEQLDHEDELARETGRHWSYGAIGFAFRARLIDEETYRGLVKEFILQK